VAPVISQSSLQEPRLIQQRVASVVMPHLVMALVGHEPRQILLALTLAVVLVALVVSQ
jgi:hypothetical protein